MALVTIKYGNSGELELTPTNLSDIGKQFSDITDIVFMLKTHAAQADEDAPLKKEMDQGQVYKTNNDTIRVKIEKADFSSLKLKANTTYLIAIGIEFNNTGEYFEDKDDHLQRKLKVTQDKVRL